MSQNEYRLKRIKKRLMLFLLWFKSLNISRNGIGVPSWIFFVWFHFSPLLHTPQVHYYFYWYFFLFPLSKISITLFDLNSELAKCYRVASKFSKFSFLLYCCSLRPTIYFILRSLVRPVVHDWIQYYRILPFL